MNTLPALLAAALLAAAPPPQERAGPSLAAPPLTCSGLDAAACTFLGEYLAQQLAAQARARVTTARELAEVLGLERQRTLLGCAPEDGACLAELGGALGVDGLVVGSAGVFGAQLAVAVKVVDARSGRALAAWSARVPRADGAQALEVGAADVARQLGVAPVARVAVLPTAGVVADGAARADAAVAAGARREDTALAADALRTDTVLAADAAPPRRWHARVPTWLPGAVGGGLVAGGATFYALALRERAWLRGADAGTGAAALEARAARGARHQALGLALVGAGAAGLVTSGLLAAARRPVSPALPGLQVGPRGGALVWSGALP